MQKFTYQYQGQTYESTARPYTEKGDLRYFIALPDGREIGIAPFHYPEQPDKLIWAQVAMMEVIIPPFYQVQAIGEGLEKSMDT
jgi:hypothetical protein